MATTSTGSTGSTGQRISLVSSNRPRRAPHPSRRKLILAVLLVMVGSFLPWVYVAGVPQSGALGPGLWTFYGAMLGLAGVLLPYPRVAAVHAALMALIAVGVPLWQVVHLVGLVGGAGWTPGPGLVVVAGGGVLAVGCALRMFREPVAAGS